MTAPTAPSTIGPGGTIEGSIGMRRTVLRCAAPSLLLAALVLVPFAHKAFTIDDTVFLFQAQHALADPLHPSAFVTAWSAPAFPVRLSQILPTGPVMAWLLVPSILAGGSEVVAHLVQLAALALAIVATVSLALQLGLAPLWAAVAGLLLAATPAALAMAGTAMPDVPATALGVAGLERLVAWRDRGGLHRAFLAAALLGLAPLARSHAIVLLGVGALLLAGDYLRSREWRLRSWTAWLPVAGSALLSLAVMFITRDPQGSSPGLAGAAMQFSDLRHVPRNLIAFAVHWVLAVPLALPWILLRPGPMSRRWWVFLVAAGAAGLQLWTDGGPLAIAFVAGFGAAVLVDVVADGWARRDSVQLTLGVWLLVALPAALYVHMPSKYLLVSAPAAALLVAREARASAAAAVRTAAAIVSFTTLAGIALGVAILAADAEFAGLGRRAAAELIAPNVAAGHRVWFSPNWGFQWYATRAGGAIVTLVPPHPETGDLLVTSEHTECSPYIKRMLTSRYGARARRIARIEDSRPGGRIMGHGAGFFSNVWGYLPWSWSEAPLDAFDVWLVE